MAARSDDLERMLGQDGSTALVVLPHGQPVLEWGDVALGSSVASIRKSVLCALFGIAVAEGRVRLQATLDELGADDHEPLDVLEKRATVEDLLRARSSVYHLAVYDTPAGRPDRGAHAPGSTGSTTTGTSTSLAASSGRRPGWTSSRRCTTRSPSRSACRTSA